jgi:hypothetical protein
VTSVSLIFFVVKPQSIPTVLGPHSGFLRIALCHD